MAYIPTNHYRQFFIPEPPPIYKGIDSRLDAMHGYWQRRHARLAHLRQEAEKIERLSPAMSALTDAQLRDRLRQLQQHFRRSDRSADLPVNEGLAAIREASARTLGLYPFPVQIMGALALHAGLLAEMATGEGKTLVAGLAAVLAAWTRKPCHVVTVNDYLAQRDAGWLQPLYSYCHATVGHVIGVMEAPDRVSAYQQDIVYTTSKELLADFLRDRLHAGQVQQPDRQHIRLVLDPNRDRRRGLVMRGLHTAIIDEADSNLIDEAVTPLIISMPNQNNPLKSATTVTRRIAGMIKNPQDYRVDRLYKEIEFTDSGRRKIEALCESLPGLWRGPARREELIRMALTANEFFLRGQQYVINEGKIIIVDEFTGRLMPGRSWRQGLHQAIEAKEELSLTDPTETLARLSVQRFFRLFPRLSGMSGTALEAGAEFWQIYRLSTLPIPVNRPNRRRDLADEVFPNRETKLTAMVERIAAIHRQGLPILVGTRSITENEALGERLRALNIEFSLLNALRHDEEAEIISQAGNEGKITIATNMAGRGTDIRLGAGIAERGGLQVILSERHESHRIDRQFFGRAGRQGDPGCAQAFISVEDELFKRYLPSSVCASLSASLRMALPGASSMMKLAVIKAQNKAQRLAFKRRRQVLTMDNWIDEALSFSGKSHGV